MKDAYYNENDPAVAAWLRELIRRNIICVGEVDERSIEVVQPEDLRGFVQCHFFAGIGVWSYALRLAGWPDTRPVWTGSCPCQPYSGAGKGEGANDPRHLWPAWIRLIRVSRPVTIFGEQVDKAIRDGWLDLVSTDLEAEGYTVGSAVFGAHSVGAFHKRQRLYFVADTNGGRVEQYTRAVSGDEGQHEVGTAEGDHGAVTGRTAHPLAHTAGRRLHSGSERGASSETTRAGEREFESAEHGLVGDPEGGRCGVGGDASREGEGGHAECADIAGGLGDAERARLEGLGGDVNATSESRRDGAITDGSVGTASESGELADASGDGRRQAGGSEPEAGSDGSLGDGGASELADTELPQPTRLGAFSGERDDQQEPEGGGASRGISFWSDAEWILCSDGKARPVEPGTFPLVVGAPFRVVRLRGYGNAIVPQAAQAFIEAYREVRGF